MQWDSSPFAGFTDRKEGGWMRTHDLYQEINVAKQQADADSTLSFWKKMIKLRKEKGELFIHGSFVIYEPDNEETFVFAKKHGDELAVVALNFTSQDQTITLPQEGLRLWLGSYPDSETSENASLGTGRERKLRPWEGRLYMLE